MPDNSQQQDDHLSPLKAHWKSFLDSTKFRLLLSAMRTYGDEACPYLAGAVETLKLVRVPWMPSGLHGLEERNPGNRGILQFKVPLPRRGRGFRGKGLNSYFERVPFIFCLMGIAFFAIV